MAQALARRLLLVAPFLAAAAAVAPAQAATVRGEIRFPGGVASLAAPPPARAMACEWMVRVPGVRKAEPTSAAAQLVVVVLEASEGRPADGAAQEIPVEGGSLTPAVVAVPAGTAVTFVRKDRLPHALYSPDTPKLRVDLLAAEDAPASGEHRFTEAGAFRIRDRLWPEFHGTVLVFSGGYATRLDAKGEYAFANVPGGSYRLRVWSGSRWVFTAPVEVPAREGALVPVNAELALGPAAAAPAPARPAVPGPAGTTAPSPADDAAAERPARGPAGKGARVGGGGGRAPAKAGKDDETEKTLMDPKL